MMVNFAVNLNNQTMFSAVKIDDERSNWVLPAKFQAVHLALA